MPNGNAPSVRTLCYALAWRALGNYPEMHIIGPTEPRNSEPLNVDVEGFAEGCRFLYTCGRTGKPKLRAMNVALQVLGIARSMRRVSKLRATSQLRGVLVYPNTLRVAVPFALLAAVLRFRLLLDVC